MLLDLLRPSRSAALAQPHARDEATGLAGVLAFEADLARAVRLGPPTLAMLALGGLDLATRTVGRRWAEAQLLRAAAVLATVTSCDEGVTGYRLGAWTFALLFTDEQGEQPRDPFALAEAIRHRIERDADPLTCAVGLATLDGIRASDPETLELAADSALDQALLLGRDGPNPVVAAADQTSGLRWIASSPSSTRSAAP